VAVGAGSLKPYQRMKDSGVPWLGEVPDHWAIKRLGEIGWFSKGSGGTKDDVAVSGVPCVRYGDLYTTHTRFIRSSRTFVSVERARDYTPIQYGDVLFAGSGETFEDIGRSAVSLIRSHACCGGDIILLRPFAAVDPAFIGYMADAYPVVNQKASRGRGTTVKHIYGHQLKSVSVVLPPRPEQVGIARFLDHADRQVRYYIRAKQKLIALLEEQRQAMIQSAVTRSLEEQDGLKASGVDWVGDIPKHWDALQLRRIVQRGRRITYGIVQPGEPDVSGRYMVRGHDYSSGWAAPGNVFRVSDDIERPYRRSRLSEGDIVLTIVGAGVGNVAVVPAWLDGANITQTTARISVDRAKAIPEFIAATLHGPIGSRNVERYIYGAAQPRLDLEHVRAFVVPVPPIAEQARIVEVLKSDTSALDRTIERARREIELVREYEARLIADIVTGKLDVREAAARLPEEIEHAEDVDEADAIEGADGEMDEELEPEEVGA
jgi:type I restriction enzyme S subunit